MTGFSLVGGSVITPGWFSTPSPGTSGQQQQPAEEVAVSLEATPSGIVVVSFGYAALAASLTDSVALRSFAGVTLASGVQSLYRASIIGLALRASGSKTGGTATFKVFNTKATGGAAAASGAELTWSNDVNKGYASFAAGTYPVLAGDELDIRVATSSAFAPTTLNVEVLLYLSTTAE